MNSYSLFDDVRPPTAFAVYNLNCNAWHLCDQQHWSVPGALPIYDDFLNAAAHALVLGCRPLVGRVGRGTHLEPAAHVTPPGPVPESKWIPGYYPGLPANHPHPLSHDA